MKLKTLFLFAALVLCLTACRSYVYRVVQPQGIAQPVMDQPVEFQYAPLEYRLTRYHNRLAMRIANPTEDQIVLVGNRSSVVAPDGESHPVRGRAIGPHSFTRMFLPSYPLRYPYPDYVGWGWGWGYGWGPYDPFWGPFYGTSFFAPPPLSYYEIMTPYDWDWKTGSARLRLTYERAGTNFEQTLEFVREPNS